MALMQRLPPSQRRSTQPNREMVCLSTQRCAATKTMANATGWWRVMGELLGSAVSLLSVQPNKSSVCRVSTSASTASAMVNDGPCMCCTAPSSHSVVHRSIGSASSTACSLSSRSSSSRSSTMRHGCGGGRGLEVSQKRTEADGRLVAVCMTRSLGVEKLSFFLVALHLNHAYISLSLLYLILKCTVVNERRDF
eukprot:7386868-Prymnesium_polylepis.1